MKAKKSQRFVHSEPSTAEVVNKKTKLPPIYLLTGIMILILALIPMAGSLMLILWGGQVIGSSVGAGLLLIIVGAMLCLTLFVGTIIFAIYYFTNDSERKLREIKYKDKIKLEDVFVKCEKCGATLLMDCEICTKCGHKMIDEKEEKLPNDKKLDQIKQYFLDTYNFEISEQNMDIITSYCDSKYKTFEYTYVTTKKDDEDKGTKVYKESILNKFLYNFKRIVLFCSIALVCLLFAVFVLSKYLLNFNI